MADMKNNFKHYSVPNENININLCFMWLMPLNRPIYTCTNKTCPVKHVLLY